MNMKLFSFILACGCAVSSYSQKTVDVPGGTGSALSPNFFTVANGEPIVFVKFKELVEGSPFFRDDWMKGNVVLNGAEKQYAGIFLKLDLHENTVHYQNQKGIEMIATTAIQRVILFDTATQQVFDFINGQFIEARSRVSGWFLLLVNGNTLLFKQLRKHVTENKPYGSATIEQSITTSSHYYVLYNGNFTEVKKIKDLADILPEKKTQIADYIKSKNIAGKSDEDFENVINYFNSLH